MFGMPGEDFPVTVRDKKGRKYVYNIGAWIRQVQVAHKPIHIAGLVQQIMNAKFYRTNDFSEEEVRESLTYIFNMHHSGLIEEARNPPPKVVYPDCEAAKKRKQRDKEKER